MKALDVARYIIDYALDHGSPITDLQLQKILYFLDGEYYKSTGKFLIDSDFVAYPLGPVSLEAYEVYKGYGSARIYDYNEIKLDKGLNQEIVDHILEKRISEPASRLVNESHEPGKAWQRTVNQKGMYCTISRDLMKEDFKNGK